MAQLEITTQVDANRLACPRNHRSITPTNNHWLCHTCARHWSDVDPEFDRVRDVKTGQEYRRDQVKLDDTVSGVY